MNKLAFCVCLLAIGGVGTMGTNACSSSSNPGSGSSSGGTEAGDDTGGSSGSSSGGGQDSSGSSSGGGSSSSGSSSGVEAGNCDVPLDGAFSCGAGEASVIQPPATQSTGCDRCIEGCCAFTWCACAGDSGMDDAGQPVGCLGFVTCVETCAYPPADSGADAGTLNECAQRCGTNYSPGQTQEGKALLSCIVGSCASTTQCGE
jgi:hypothetical protein